MPKTTSATQFVAPSGKVIVYLTSIPRDGELLYSPDGVTFYALACSGFGGSTDEHRLSFSDPHQGTSGTLVRKGDVIFYNGEQYSQQEVSFDQSSVVPLPALRRTEYLYQFKDGRFLYISAGRFNFSYESFKLFVGDGTIMREIPILNVQRYKDGGTTYIQTVEGNFYSPSPIKTQRNAKLLPTWSSQWLTRLNEDDYIIVETPEGEVSITKR